MDTMTLTWSILYVLMSVTIMFFMFRLIWMDNSEYRPFLLLALFCAGLIQVAKIAGISSPTWEGYFQASKLEYLGKCYVSAFSISFVTRFYKIKTPRWLMVLLYFVSMGFFFIILFDDYHHLYYSYLSHEKMAGSVDYAVGHGPLYFVYMGFLFCVLASFLIVCRYHYKKEGKYHKDLSFQILLMVGGTLPFVGVALCIVGALNGTDFTPIFTGLSVIIMSYGVMKYGLFDPVALSKEAVITSTNTGVIVFDRYKRYMYANDIAKSILNTVDFDQYNVEGYELESLFATPGRIFERGEKSYEVNTAEINNKGNKIEGFIAYFTDVTDLFAQNKELNKLKAKAESTAAQKSTFLANMSHEIRTPMNAILGMSELALKQNPDEKTKGNLEQIRNAADSLITIVNDILDVSKMESGKFKITESKYSLRKMVEGVEQIERRVLDKKGLKYSVDIDESIPDELYGDDIRIKQVLINLVNNAAKYTEEGSVAVRVRSHKGRTPDEISLEFSVKDTGIGIKAEDKDRIFKNYEQTDAGLSLRTEGTGLGLSICKELVSLMHGSIGVESIYGTGSRFYFEIPQKIAKEGYIERKETYQEATASWMAKNVKALVVDDTEVNLKVTEGFLNIYGIEADLADNGQAAVSKAITSSYDLIFIDKLMPQMDGLETIREMKANGVEALFIALSGDVTEEAQAEFKENGFVDFLAKPLMMSNLEQCLLRHLSEDKIIRR